MNTINILKQLVGFDTTSHNSNLELIDWIGGYLSDHNVQHERIPDATGEKFNLRASIGPSNANGFVLSGHTDVVPVKGQDWHTNPFNLVQKDDRLYGRGSADMKGFLASVLAAVPAMKQTDLARPIHLAFTYDEEVGCLGVPSLIDGFSPAAAVIVGEPTSMKVVDNHKGGLSEQIVVKGIAAHSSMPDLGVNAIEFASLAIQEISMLDEWLETQEIQVTETTKARSTVSVGKISGGVAHNIIPERCEFVWSLRLAPGHDASQIRERLHRKITEIESRMQRSHSDCSINIEVLIEIPSLIPDKNSIARDLCLGLTGEKEAIGVNFGTEAGFFSQAKYSTVVCGPGSIDQAHKPNEYIEISQLKQCDQFIERLIQKAKTE
jgi:acetylornithine deacetylase